MKKLLASVLSFAMVVSLASAALPVFAGAADSETNVVTISSTGVNQSNNEVLNYVSTKHPGASSTTTATSIIGLNDLTNLANTSNTTRSGKTSSATISFAKPIDDVAFDNLVGKATDSNMGTPDHWIEKSLSTQGAKGWKSIDVSIDFTVDLGVEKDIKGLLFAASNPNFRFGGVEIYTSNNSSDLYDSAPKAKVIIDDSLVWNFDSEEVPQNISNNSLDIFKVADGQTLRARYVGFRITKNVIFTKTDYVDAYFQILRIGEIGVYGTLPANHTHTTEYQTDDTHHWIDCPCGYVGEKEEHNYQSVGNFSACVCGLKNNDTLMKVEKQGDFFGYTVVKESGVDFTKSIIAGKSYLYARYINKLIDYNTPTPATDPDIAKVNGSKEIHMDPTLKEGGKSDNGEYRIGNSTADDKKYFFFHDEQYVDDESKIYFDLAYDIGYIAKFDKIAFCMANDKPAAALYHYKFSFANDKDALFTEDAIETTGDIYNEESSRYVVYSFNKEVKARYFAIRIICSHQYKKNDPNNPDYKCNPYWYINLGNISVFGDYACGGNHNYERTPLRVPNCTLDGVDIGVCKECTLSKRLSVDPLGHSFTNYDTYVPADCTNDAMWIATCDNEGCNVTDSKPIKNTATGHTFVATSTVKPTGTKKGFVGGTHCSVCDEIKVQGKTVYAIKSVKLSTSEYTYSSSKVRKPSVTVTDVKGKKVASDLYTVEYAKGRKNVGKYAVTVKFKNGYAPTKTVYFTILPKASSVKSVSGGSKKLTVKLSKVSSQATGYEIQYSTSSKFSSKYTKKATVSSYKTTSKTIKSLKANKKYYVRVRTYKTVSSKKYYSDWSKAKSVKTKK